MPDIRPLSSDEIDDVAGGLVREVTQAVRAVMAGVVAGLTYLEGGSHAGGGTTGGTVPQKYWL